MKKPKKVSESRILQITNDVSEDIHNPATVHELRETIRYWAKQHYNAHANANNKGAGLALKLLELANEAVTPIK